MAQNNVATIVARTNTQLTLACVNEIARALGGKKAAWLRENHAADIFFGSDDPATAYTTLRGQVADQPFDVIIQPAEGRRKRLLVADMESTIIEQEMLDELAELIGVRDQVATITARAMNGELDFEAALRERVGLFKNQPVSILDEVASRMTLMPGAAQLIATMKTSGATCWLVSGGLSCFVKLVAEKLGFDRCYANDLLTHAGFLTGEVATPVLGKDAKKTFLEKACTELNLQLQDTLAVGDGANDVPMLSACNAGHGLGVAYHAKPNVRAVVLHQINQTDLVSLLYAQGFTFSSQK